MAAVCAAAIIMAAIAPHVGAAPTPTKSRPAGCNTDACAERVKARVMAERHGGCRSMRCVRRVRARMQPRSPRAIGRRMAATNGTPWRCVDRLIHLESSWKVKATNRSSGAYGLPQSLPGHKMASAGRDWRTSARTQLRWFFQYCRARYRGVCNALAFHRANGWY